MRHPIGEVLEVARARQSRGDSPRLGRAIPRLSGPNATSSTDRRAEELVVRILEDQADPAADLGGVPGVISRPSIQTRGAPLRPGSRSREPAAMRMHRLASPLAGQQAVEVQQQRALARAVGADQGHRLARHDRQLGPTQREPAVG